LLVTLTAKLRILCKNADSSRSSRRTRLTEPTDRGSEPIGEGDLREKRITITIAQEFPEEKYGFRPAPNTRTVGELLAHISLAHNFQYQIHGQERRSSLEGFNFPSLMQRLVAEEKAQRSKDQIIEMLRNSGEKRAGWLDGLTDSFLGERVARAGISGTTKDVENTAL